LETSPVTLVLILPLLRAQQGRTLRADMVRATGRVSIGAGRARDASTCVTEPINARGWREALQQHRFQLPAPGKAALSSELHGLACGPRG